MRLLFTTSPLHGHFSPLVPLAWACRLAGHGVLVATSENFAPAVVDSGLPVAVSGPGTRLHELADVGSTHGIEDARYAHGEAFAGMALRNLAGTLELMDDWRPDLVVSERAEIAGPIAAAARGVPHVELHWGIAELGEYRAAAANVLAPTLRTLGLRSLPTPELTLDPWPASLRLPHAAGHVGLRHLPYDGVARVAPWMLRPPDRPRICLTFGTVLPQIGVQSMASLVRSMVDSLAELDCELVLAMEGEITSQLQPLPATVRHVGRVPLSDMVRTSELLVHHGGQGSALTALVGGCPQVVLPCFDDQLENAVAVANAGAGLWAPLESTSPQLLAQYCHKVLDNSNFAAAAAAISQEIAAQTSPAEIVGVLERLVAPRLGPPSGTT